MPGYVQKFKEKFPDKMTPEMNKAFHGGESKIKEFTLDQVKKNKGEIPGILFVSGENSARHFGPYVTQAMLKLVKVVSTQFPPKRDDVTYMISKCPNKEEKLREFDKDPREAFFKAIDEVMSSGNAYNCFKLIAEKFYDKESKLFVKGMIHLGLDGTIITKNGKTVYVVFNPKCIHVVH